MPDNSQIFSKEALDKLRSPERLDLMLSITSPIAWMSLAAVGVVLFSILLWSIFGAFTVKADGMGLILDSAGVVNISHIRGGKVTEVYIHKGSHVYSDEVIARVEHLEQAADTQIARHGPELAENKREITERVYKSDSKKYQETIIEEIRSDYAGTVDRVFIRNGNIINGGIMEIVFDLVKDKNSESGYLWTTFVGEHKEISAGSFCTGSIIIDRRTPIEKVFYNLSQWLRNR